MKIKSAEFIISNTRVDMLPQEPLPEYAFIGRSNVGKSSLINCLMAKKGLAKTSQTPGKTQLINHFLINKNWNLVDLPGYGYARASKTEIAKWDSFIKRYLTERKQLVCVFSLIDSRLEPQKKDIEFLNWLGKKGIPFVLVFTKADKQSHNKTFANIQHFNKELLKSFTALPLHFVSSAEAGTGREEILDYIELLNASIPKNFTESNTDA